MTKDIDDLRARFVWTRDKRESWRILDAPDGPLLGDCDDFAVTALWLAEGKSVFRFWWALLTFRAVIWSVRGVSFGSHAALWHRDFGWIDNGNPTWGDRKYPLSWPWPIFMAALKMLIGKL